MQCDVSNRVVIVTGAASGLGRATALAFAAGGARVFAVDRNPDGLTETAAMAAGGMATFATDLSNAANCALVVDKALAEYGCIDGLCNIAGLLRIEPMDQVTPETWDMIYAVNVRAPFFLTQAALPHLVGRGGTVVNISSATAFAGYAYMTAYTSSKSAVMQMTRSLAMEFIKSDVRINAIAPGGVNTPMGSGGGAFAEGVDVDLLMRAMGVRPNSEPEELTGVILYLSSPQNTIFHGACLHTDNGFTAG